MSIPVIELDDVTKVYPLPAGDVTALSGISIRIDEGEFVAIMGPSGSGKSTLLNQIGCLDRPTSGDLFLAGKNTREMDDRELTSLRLSSIGYIFQKFNLIPLLSAYENVEYPYIMKHRKNDDTGRVRDLLALVGIDESLSTHKPNELSGGQQQRVAIARALVNDPAILLCDEPTGNLDSQTGTQIMEALSELHKKGRTIVMVTHESEIAAYAERTIVIRDGRVA
ncbi:MULTISPECIES: ABC transporter ATP-binding protein [Methanoculleus]|jgi:putative ABC transport system ATP-binding protein|uniref:ABC transporter ATP-binding protein n=3 Tax=Methanoculleus TaxID=45989 RepID=A0A0H1QYX6_9EURY|nr:MULTISPECIES: ABC transporter ATP-binding protein [Methanoculleus]ABN57747.1 ABC transporter-related protein [Methanoculleus marisnigri JR1]KLK88138.1 ABC transporter ATP-binding protein [Methanoculleus sediminis]MCC7556762.1 ABC transporter ATP-binding protein [Methanoculleus marisnigri]UYU19138.1 ABC transporter ATP-binding protein [Methanoculleus submarinus]